MTDGPLLNYLDSRDTATEPGTFTTLAGFGRDWTRLRGDLIEAHGYHRNAPNIRLAAGSIVMDVQLGGRWVLFTDNGPDMRDRVRLGGTFRLRVKGSPRH